MNPIRIVSKSIKYVSSTPPKVFSGIKGVPLWVTNIFLVTDEGRKKGELIKIDSKMNQNCNYL